MSSSELWIRSRLPSSWSWLPVYAVRVALTEILPVADLSAEIELPPLLDVARIFLYGDRLQALETEADTLDALQRALNDVEAAVPADVTAMVEHLWFENGETPFSDTREAARGMTDRLETWESALEHKRQALCRDILGVRIGDDVLVTERDRPFRLRADHLYVHAGESGTTLRFTDGGSARTGSSATKRHGDAASSRSVAVRHEACYLRPAHP